VEILGSAPLAKGLVGKGWRQLSNGVQMEARHSQSLKTDRHFICGASNDMTLSISAIAAVATDSATGALDKRRFYRPRKRSCKRLTGRPRSIFSTMDLTNGCSEPILRSVRHKVASQQHHLHEGEHYVEQRSRAAKCG
jgi:hypothetical protein